VGVEANQNTLTVFQVADEPFHLIGVNVGRGHLHGGGQIEDNRVLRGGLPNFKNGFADFEGKFGFGITKAFGGVLEANIGPAQFPEPLFYQFGSFDGEVEDLILGESEGDPSLEWIGGIIEVNDRFLGAFETLNGAFDQAFPCLNQCLNGNVTRNVVFLDELSGKSEFGVRCGGETHFDLFEPGGDQKLPEFEFFRDIHGDGKGLIAIPQINAAPDGRMRYLLVGPAAVGKGYSLKRPVLGDGWLLHHNNQNGEYSLICLKVQTLIEVWG